MVVLLFLKLFLSSLVLSPRSEKHGDVVSTSTDSGSVIIDMVGRIKTSERTGGRDSGMSIHCIPELTESPLFFLLLGNGNFVFKSTVINSRLLRFCMSRLGDWYKKLRSPSQPIRNNTKIMTRPHTYSRS